MSATDDISPLLRQAPSDVGFRQGTVVKWDTATGTNTVDIGGTRVENMPCLNIGDFVTLEPGDIVGLLRFKSTFFILGRIVPPTPPDPDRAVVAFDTASNQESGFAITTTPTARAPVTLNVPSWADEAVVTVLCLAQGWKDVTPNDYIGPSPFINGVSFTGLWFEAATGAGRFGGGTVGASTLITSFGSTITASTTVVTSGNTWAANVVNAAVTHAVAIFRRTS